MAVDQQEAPGSVPADGVRMSDASVKRRAWIVVALLVCLMVVNYADKVVVGLAGVGMKKELGLDNAQFGVIQSSFFWLFAVGCILGGWLGGKVRARWLLAGIAGLWALTLAPMTAQVGFTVVVLCRVLLGFAEGPTAALAMQVAHSWFPAHRRAIPSSVVVAGAGIGPVIANPVLTAVITHYSWHAAFGVLAAFGLVIAALWLVWGRSGPEGASAGHGPGEGGSRPALPERVPLGRLFRTGTLIGISLLFFVAYAYTAVKVSWLPLYLQEGLGYDAETAGNLASLPYIGAVVSVLLVGVISTVMTRRGVSNRITRGLLPAALVLVAGVCSIGMSMLDQGTPQMVMIILGASLNSAGYGVAYAGIADIAPAKQRGMVFGIITAVYSLGGVVAPLVLGKLVASGDSVALGYGDGFLVLGVTMIIGAVAALLLVDPDRDVAKLAAEA
ncbi:MFS transporter [Streptomyces sp. NBC_00683]|uniref:MFS transporter n=1 Tax=Streptomyces sp. NBC_00683 TaxID=2903670 RepID=UPI002E352EDE|nr:MFS transporter [Streptomyces sp. NBC_00683]